MIQAVTDAASPRGNEDRFGYAAGAAWVLDGATDLSGVDLEGRTAAWWLVEALQAELTDCVAEGADSDAFEFLTRLSSGARRRLDRRFGKSCRAVRDALEQASSALSIVRKIGRRWTVIALADCPVLYRQPATGEVTTIVNEGFSPVEQRSMEALEQARRLEPEAGLKRLSELTRPVLMQNRALMNAEGGYAVGAIRPPPRSIVCEYHLPEGVEAVAIMSDGFSRWFDLFQLGSAGELFQQIEAGQAPAALAELRERERSDPEGREFARFKTHDDATCFYAGLDDL